MDRKDFLKKICISGVCAYPDLMFLTPKDDVADDDEKQKADWRISFSRTRYSKFSYDQNYLL